MRLFVLLLLTGMFACTTTEKESPAETSDSLTVESPVADQTEISEEIVADSSRAIPPRVQAKATLEARAFIVGKDTSLIISLRTKALIEVIDTVDSFDPIRQEDFAQFDIPVNALNAGGAWHEEAGEYFYVIEEGQDLVVYRAWLKEEQTTNTYPYKELSRFSLPDVEL